MTVGADGQASGTVDRRHAVHPDDERRADGAASSPRSASQPGQAQWRDIVPERADAIIETVSFGKGVIAVTYLKNAANVVEVFDFKGTSLGVVSQPGIGAAAVTAELDRTEAYLTFTSFNYPTTIFRVDLATPQARAGALGAARRAGRSGDRGSRAGLVPVEGRHHGSACSSSTRRD